jgi:hypothetical protein
MKIHQNIKTKLVLGERRRVKLKEYLEQIAVWYDIFVNCIWGDTRLQ